MGSPRLAEQTYGGVIPHISCISCIIPRWSPYNIFPYPLLTPNKRLAPDRRAPGEACPFDHAKALGALPPSSLGLGFRFRVAGGYYPRVQSLG